MTAKALLDAEPAPSRERIKEAIAGVLCRCTGYQQIVDSIERAASDLREERK
jgi:carbon-monoxide dehydrogenase small subunit